MAIEYGSAQHSTGKKTGGSRDTHTDYSLYRTDNTFFQYSRYLCVSFYRYLWVVPDTRDYRYCTGTFISPTAFEQARGGALGAGGGRVGFAGGGLF
jgi:hypothetical protein